MKWNIYILFFLLIAFSCKKENESNRDREMDIEKVEQTINKEDFTFLNLIQIWKEDGYGQFNLSKKIDDFEFTSTYKPYSILAMEELDSVNMEEHLSHSFKDKVNGYSKMHYVNFNIKNDKFKNELIKLDVEDNQGYYDRITYYSFGAKNDVYMIEDKDTLKCDFVNFERTYEANPSVMLTFVFSRKSQNTNYKNLKLIFEDKIFNKGKLIFNYDTQPILLLNYLKPLS